MSEDLKEVRTQTWGIVERHPGSRGNSEDFEVSVLDPVQELAWARGLVLVTSRLSQSGPSSVPEAWKTLGVTFFSAPCILMGTILICRAEVNSSHTVRALEWGLQILSGKSRRATIVC